MKNLPNGQIPLEDRTFGLAIKVLKFLRKLKYSSENDVIRHQLTKSITSVGANYEESQGASSPDDFKYKIALCLKEARESNYWLRIINALGLCPTEEIQDLLRESSELKNILGSIMKKLNSRTP